jgi:hypothetical protein
MPSMAFHIDHVKENGAYEEDIPGIVNIRSGIQVRNNQKIIYSEADPGSDCQGSDPFFGFWERGVNKNKKYRNIRLF